MDLSNAVALTVSERRTAGCSMKYGLRAKKDETRLRRLVVLIESAEKGRKVPPLIVGRKKQIEPVAEAEGKLE